MMCQIVKHVRKENEEQNIEIEEVQTIEVKETNEDKEEENKSEKEVLKKMEYKEDKIYESTQNNAAPITFS